nr:MAG TPA: hypothetical protein [Caudoviricetes sp.]
MVVRFALSVAAASQLIAFSTSFSSSVTWVTGSPHPFPD